MIGLFGVKTMSVQGTAIRGWMKTRFVRRAADGVFGRPRPPAPSVRAGQPGVVVAVILLVLALDGHADGSQRTWFPAGKTVTLEVPGAANLGDRLRVLVGDHDITAMVTIAGDHLAYVPQDAGLGSGEHDVVLQLAESLESWTEHSRHPVGVLTRSGFETARLTPRMALDSPGQWLEQTRGSAFPSSPQTWQRVGMQAGLSSYHRRGPWQLSGSANVIGRSEQNEALRFASEGNAAPRVDMTDYLVELAHGESHRAALGHVSFGAHRLLAANIAHRGALVSTRLSEQHEVKVTALRGNAVVGYDHLLGISDQDHRIYAASWTFSPFPSVPLAPRLELTWMDAAILPLDDFDTGQVRDAERSRGLGLSVTGLGERLEYELLHARSRFTNPDDPFLAQDIGLVSVRSETSGASAARLLWRLNGLGDLGIGWPVNLEVESFWDRSDPLYRTVGAWVEPDRENASLRLGASVGLIQLQAAYRVGRDNLDDVRSLLTSRTRDLNLSLSVPLSQMVRGRTAPWLPDLVMNGQRIWQFAGNTPDPLTSGFSATHLPDQVNRLMNVQAAWYRQKFDFTLGLTKSLQNNRQVGRERSDFDNKDLNASFNWRLNPRLDVGLTATLSSYDDREFSVTRRTRALGTNLNWYATDRLAIALSLFDQKQDDSNDANTSRNLNANLQASWNFAVRFSETRELPGQFFLRWGHQDNHFVDRVFEVNDRGRTWVVNTGVSLTLF